MPPSTSSLTNSPTPIPSLSPGPDPTVPPWAVAGRTPPYARADGGRGRGRGRAGRRAGRAGGGLAGGAGRAVGAAAGAGAGGRRDGGLVRGGRRPGRHRQPPAAPGHPGAGAEPAARPARRRPADPAAQRPAAGVRPLGRLPAPPDRAGPDAAADGRAADRPGRRDPAVHPARPGLVRLAAGQHARPGALQRALRAVRGEAVGAARPGHRRRAGPPPGRRRRRLGHRPHAGPPGPLRAGAGVLLPAPRLRPDRRRARRGGGRGPGRRSRPAPR